jgi:NADPH:quinone reductase-like Zn-dependent oxidoreductase
MKAIVCRRYGAPEELQMKEVEKPLPGEKEVLIRVRATSVNRTDCANLWAKPFIMRFSQGLFKPGNPIMGTEFAGDIEAIGKSVTTLKVGDKVFGFDDGGVGAYADYMVISEDKGLTTMPKGITYEQAAGCLEGAHYAINFINKVDLRSGHKTLVNGASGGIGSATVQLLKYYNADITGVCNAKNMDLVKSLGASRVIDYQKEDFTKLDAQYDCIFDSVGKSSFGRCKHLLKSGGVYMSSELGWFVQNLFFALLTGIFGSLPGQAGKKVKFPYPPNIRRSVLFVKKIIEEGKYIPVIDRSYPLEKIADAFRYVVKGQKTGNVVITITDNA